MNKKIAFFFILFLVSELGGLFLFRAVNNANASASASDLNLKASHNNEILIKNKTSEELEILKVDESEDFYEILEHIKQSEHVESVEPNFTYKASIIPTDTYFDNQWYLKKIKAPEAWNEIRDAENIVIAVIDTGVQISHPDLRDNIWLNKKEIANNNIDDDKNGYIDDINGWDFVNGIADPSPKFKEGFTQDGILHGTIVAGVVAASGNNASGISGIAWTAKIMPLKVLDDSGEGNTKNVVKAIDYAVANGADIINLSFVGFGYSLNLKEAIERAYHAGVVIVAAAGNEEGGGNGNFLDKTPMYPVCYDGNKGENMVIGVAATDALDQKASFSGYGTKCIDVSAPGLSIFSTTVYNPNEEFDGNIFNKYYDGFWSGTSMATPMVSAAIALIEAVNPAMGADEAVEILMNNTDNISRLNTSYLGELGRGRINLFKAVTSAKILLGSKENKLLIAPYRDYLSQVDIRESQGKVVKTIQAYNENFRGGVNVASGDINGDGIDEIITGAGFSGGPHVRVFDSEGNLISQFFAYSPNFRGGVNVASGDINGDDVDEIITGAGFGGGPQVRIFKGNGSLEGQFFAYDSNFRGGVRVSTANMGKAVRGKKKAIITIPGETGGAQIRIFDNYANVLGQFFAYHEKFKGGATLSVADMDNDGIDEIVTGAGPGGAPHVKIFNTDGSLLSSFYAYDKNFAGGVNVGVIQVKK